MKDATPEFQISMYPIPFYIGDHSKDARCALCKKRADHVIRLQYDGLSEPFDLRQRSCVEHCMAITNDLLELLNAAWRFVEVRQ